MKTTFKKALSILLLIAMLASMFCSVSFAEGEEPLPYVQARKVSEAITDGDYDYYQVTLTIIATQNASDVTISDTLNVKDASFSTNSKYASTADSVINGNTISWTLPGITSGSLFELTYWYRTTASKEDEESGEDLIAKLPELRFADSIPVYFCGAIDLLDVIDLSVSCNGTNNKDHLTEYSFYTNKSVSPEDLIGTYLIPKGATSGSWTAGSGTIDISDSFSSITVVRTVNRPTSSGVDMAQKSIYIPLTYYYPQILAVPQDIYSSNGSTEPLNNVGPEAVNGILYTIQWFDNKGVLIPDDVPASHPDLTPLSFSVSMVGSTDIVGASYKTESSDGTLENTPDEDIGSRITYTLGSRDTDFRVVSFYYAINGIVYTAKACEDLAVIPASGEHPVTPAAHDFTVYSNPVKVSYNDDDSAETPLVSTDPFHNGLSVKLNPNGGNLDGNPAAQIIPLTADKALNDPVRNHYVFDGWECSPEFPDRSNPELIYIFTAQWNPEPEDVVYKDSDDNKNDNTQVVSYLDKILVDPNEGVWAPDETIRSTVTDPRLNDSYEEPVAITVPADIELLNDPERNHYYFLGWKKTPGEGDIQYVFTAQWAPEPEDVVYKDSDNNKKNNTQVVSYLDKILVDPNKGVWAPDDVLKSVVSEPVLNNSYEKPVVITVPADIALLNDPELENYTFIGWQKTPGEGEIKYVFTAQWIANPEDVVYKDADDNKKDHTQIVSYLDKILVDPNEGIWSPDNTLKTSVSEPELLDSYETPVKITVPTDIALLKDPVRDEYTFMGWKKTPGTGDIKYVFTAQWEKLNYTVEIIKVDSENERIHLPYAAFELYMVKGDKDILITALTTDTTGSAFIEHLSTGSYYLKEIRAPQKYKLSKDNIEFVIEENNLKTEVVCPNELLRDAEDVLSAEHHAYIIGRDDGLIHPDANITRAEVATIFFRLLDDDIRSFYMSKENSFSDVPANQWFNCAISTMANMGIINGYDDGTFRPDAPITRAEFATIAARFDTVKDPTDAGFTDLNGHWARKYINYAANRGWVNGYNDGTFCPNNLITRAEAMALVNRVANRNPKRLENLLDNMILWPDNSNTNLWYYFDIQEATNSHDYIRNMDGTEKWTKFLPARDWKLLEQID